MHAPGENRSSQKSTGLDIAGQDKTDILWTRNRLTVDRTQAGTGQDRTRWVREGSGQGTGNREQRTDDKGTGEKRHEAGQDTNHEK